MSIKIPDQYLKIMASKFRLLSDSSRLAILRSIMEKERHVTEIVALTGLSQANVSKHLRLLLDSEMIARRKEGLKVYYSLKDPIVERICHLACAALRESDDTRKAKHRGR